MKMLVGILLAGLVFLGCDGASEDSDPAAAVEETEDTDTADTGGDTGDDTGEPDVAAPGTLAFSNIDTPAKGLAVLESSLKAVPDSAVGQTLKTPGTLAIGLTEGAQDSECNDNSRPLAQDGETTDGDNSTTLTASDASYAQRHFYCLTKTGTSPETMLGSIVINKGLLCAVDNAGGLAEEKYGVEQDLTITIDTNCFTAEFVTAMNNEGDDDDDDDGGSDSDSGGDGESDGDEGMTLTQDPIQFPIKITVQDISASNENWDMQIDLSQDGEDSQYFFKNYGDSLAIARTDKMSDGNYGSGYVAHVSSEGKVWFENRLFPVPGSGFDGTMHIRLLIEGTFDATNLTLSDISKYEGASGDFIAGTNGNFQSGRFSTLKGTAADGFFVRGLYCNADHDSDSENDCTNFANWQVAGEGCIEGGTCTDNSGIAIGAPEIDFLFPDDLSEHTLMGAFLEQVELPLSYESVTLDDIP